MAIPTIVSHVSTTQASATSLTINAPASITKGNILVLVLYLGGGSSPQITSDNSGGKWFNTGLTNIGTSVWIKVAGSAEPATYTISWTTSNPASAIIFQISDALTNYLGLYDVGVATSNAASTSYTAGSVTTRTANCLLVSIYAGSTANAITVPGGQTPFGSTFGNSRCIIGGYETLTTAGATGTRVATGTSAANFGFNLAFRDPSFSVVEYPINNTSYANASVYGDGNRMTLLGANAELAYGTSSISGFTYNAGGSVISMSVILKKQSSFSARNQILAQTSNPVTGAFLFDKLAAGLYTIYSYDPNEVEISVLKTITLTAGNTTNVLLQPISGGASLSAYRPLYMGTNGHVKEMPSSTYVFTKYNTTVGNGSSTSFTITHGLNTREVIVVVRRTASPYDLIDCYITATDVNNVTLDFASAPSSGEYTVTILG